MKMLMKTATAPRTPEELYLDLLKKILTRALVASDLERHTIAPVSQAEVVGATVDSSSSPNNFSRFVRRICSAWLWFRPISYSAVTCASKIAECQPLGKKLESVPNKRRSVPTTLIARS